MTNLYMPKAKCFEVQILLKNLFKKIRLYNYRYSWGICSRKDGISTLV